ncbi:4-hydroxythreonine-4-phosphate dehydrogenase [Helicobacter sp. 13S00477-4]|uniref:4-hydroxythreonine-4-phosphate dehydrogenase n=1 Tax=Helicobacter sp. 13S00477-4 TaxID=1905759 RepID=UPI000BA56E13|nr:4-hydroxythreonine-4-phosphate dehydrogenase [Helicobacter sp. 13S00477-4]PAF52428.1 4-hydroxythreonine-4-phosphate dehydrogenase [Helicobacter sp. 13S00477-4]
MKKIAISIGDLNGIGPQIAITQHDIIKKICHPIYCVHKTILDNACDILKIPLPKYMELSPPNSTIPEIHPGMIEAQSGRYSYESFLLACQLTEEKKTHSVCTLPIHKKAWKLAGINEIGHTEVLAKRYKKNTMMMLGCQEMFVALFTDHIPLKETNKYIKPQAIKQFLISLHQCIKMEKALVLGFNPHCGDNGLIGNEDELIAKGINLANKLIKKEVFIGPIPTDTAFSPMNRKKYKFFIAMYHDAGLAPLKALYFEESINVTLNIPIFRTSVDHGVAYDIAYRIQPNTKSYFNAITLAAHKWRLDE